MHKYFHSLDSDFRCFYRLGSSTNTIALYFTLVIIKESRGRQSLLEFYYTLSKRFHRILVYILYTRERVKLYLIQRFICPVFRVPDLTVVSFGFFSSGRGKYK